MTTTHCADCGAPLQQRANGSFLQCCSGTAYWYDGPVRPADAWFPLQKSGRFALYVNPTRPDLPVVPPID